MDIPYLALASIFFLALPGYAFLFILARQVFKKPLTSSSRSLTLIIGFSLSIALLQVFDANLKPTTVYVLERYLPRFLPARYLNHLRHDDLLETYFAMLMPTTDRAKLTYVPATNVDLLIRQLEEVKYSSNLRCSKSENKPIQFINYKPVRTLEYRYPSEKIDKYYQIQNLFFTVLMLGFWALIFGWLVSLLSRAGTALASSGPRTPIVYLTLFGFAVHDWLHTKILSDISRLKNSRHRYIKHLHALERFSKLMIPFSARLLELSINSYDRLYVLVRFLLIILIKILRWVVRLFTNPWDDVFKAESSVGRIPMIEIKAADGVIYRGIFCDYHASDEKTVSSIKLSHVLAMTVTNSEKIFARGDRKVLRFSNSLSKLNVPFENVLDFNQWHLEYQHDHWIYPIRSQTALTTHIWYFEILMTRFPAHFLFRDFNVHGSAEYSVELYLSLLNLLMKHFINNPWKRFLFRRRINQNFEYLQSGSRSLFRDYRRHRNGMPATARLRFITDYRALRSSLAAAAKQLNSK